MLELFTSAKLASYILSAIAVSHFNQPQPLHHLSFTLAYNKKIHFQTCLSMLGMESTLTPACASDENVQNASLTYLCKKTHTKLNLKCPEHSMWAFLSFRNITSVIENFRGFGSYLFIYSKPHVSHFPRGTGDSSIA